MPDDEPKPKGAALEVAKTAGVTVLRVAGAMVPGVGLALLIGEGGMKLAQALKVDMERVQVAAMGDEIVRLRDRLAELEQRMTSPVEVLEIALNVMASYPTIFRRDKRRLLTSALVNGVADECWDAERTRYFVRAMSALEPEHVSTLAKHAEKTIFLPSGVFAAPVGTLEAGYLYQLHGWQFLGTPQHADAPGSFEVTRLGTEFLAHLWEPEAGENPYTLWPAIIDLRDASMPVYTGFWPELRELRRFEIVDGRIILVAEHKDGHDVRLTAEEVFARAEKWRTAPRF